MLNALQRLWNDQSGFIVTMELVLIATITGLGLIVGLTMIRDALVSEMADIAQSIAGISQSGERESGGLLPPVDEPGSEFCILYSLPPSEEL
jgi:hypothetical protein